MEQLAPFAFPHLSRPCRSLDLLGKPVLVAARCAEWFRKRTPHGKPGGLRFLHGLETRGKRGSEGYLLPYGLQHGR